MRYKLFIYHHIITGATMNGNDDIVDYDIEGIERFEVHTNISSLADSILSYGMLEAYYNGASEVMGRTTDNHTDMQTGDVTTYSFMASGLTDKGVDKLIEKLRHKGCHIC